MSDGTAAQTPPRVFISYSHDSDAHRKRVLALAERLRQDGIDADLDQYVKGTPREKWPRWMLNRLDWADFVLLICTSTYYRRFRGHEEPGKGKGVDWEGTIITDAIYDDCSATLKFVPVLFDLADQRSIPTPVRGQSFFCLTSEIGYRGLYDFLLGQSGTEPHSLGQLKRKTRDRAALPNFPGTEGKPAQETATTPAQLWSVDTLATGSGEATDCYARLYAICARGEVPRTKECRSLWQAVKKDRPSSFVAWQLATVARWGAPEYLEVDEYFTPLQVQVQVRERDEGPAEKQHLSCDTLAEAMSAVFEEQMAPASVIFAPPGGGKSTLLRHYQLQQARRLGEEERLVLYVQLRDYRPEKLPEADPDTELPALAWLESEWRRETGQAPSLAAFLRQGSLTLLLDGLNEIPRDSDYAYRTRIGEWRDLVEAVDRDYPGVHLLFACRSLDYSQRLDAGRHTRLPEIEVQAMEPERIKAFVDKRFDSLIADKVWAQLQDRPALALYSSPYALNLLLGQIDTAAGEIEIPQDRAALFSGMVRARLRRECQKGSARFADPELLVDRDRNVLMSGKPRAHWLPGDTPFFDALSALAFHIQDAGGSNERWGRLRWNKARKAMAAAQEEKPDIDNYLHAGCDLGLFEDESAQAGEIRFVHQLIQEYFAARYLAAKPGLDDLERIVRKYWFDDDWKETLVLASSLRKDSTSFLQLATNLVYEVVKDVSELIHLLEWATERPRSLPESQSPLAVRAFYLTLLFYIERGDLGEPTYDAFLLLRDRICDHAKISYNSSLELDRCLSEAYSFSHFYSNRLCPQNLEKAKSHSERLGMEELRADLEKLPPYVEQKTPGFLFGEFGGPEWEAWNEERSELQSGLRRILSTHRGFGRGWDLLRELKERPEKIARFVRYLKGTSLLLECSAAANAPDLRTLQERLLRSL